MTLALLVISSQALAQEDPKAAAGRSFDAGVKAYERAAYEDAAQAFLRADAISPSDESLGNALTSATRAGAWLLLVDAAKRAINREAGAPALAAKGRRALAEASLHLAKVEIACEPTPCTLEIDGTTVERGERYVLPGTHVMTARADGTAEERMSLQANATYQVTLHPAKPGEAARPAEIHQAETQAKPEPSPAKRSDLPPQAEQRPLPPAVFYAAAGVTVALVGLTTWSGLDALSGKNDLGDRPTKSEVEDVRTKIRRTDYLLAGTVVAAAATVYIGVALVDFSGGSARVGISPLGRGIALDGRF